MTAIFRPSLNGVTLEYDGEITDSPDGTMYIDGKPVSQIIMGMLEQEASQQYKRLPSLDRFFLKGPGDIALLRPGDRVSLPGHKIQLIARIYKTNGKKLFRPNREEAEKAIESLREQSRQRLEKMLRRTIDEHPAN